MQQFTFNQPQAQAQPFGAGGGAPSTGFGFGGFGGQTTQPAFGASFGTPATSTVAPTFGTGSQFAGFGGNTFGTPQQTGTTFGAPQLASTPFGGGATGATTFGSTAQPVSTGFGTTQPTVGFGTAAPGTGFGTSVPGSLFGGTQQQQATGAFGTGQTAFGAQPTTGAFGSTLGTSTFGTTQPLFGTTQASTGFGTTQASTGFGTTQAGTGFGTTPASTGFGTTQPSMFGSTGTQQPGSWFGSSQPQTSTFGGFGGGTSLFGQQKTTAFSFAPSFGQPQQSLFSQPTQQQQAQQQQSIAIDEQAAFHQSIFGCCKFGDERDAILANLNYVQACWGTGKGYYNQTHPPVIYNDKNVFYRFKAVGYSFMYTDSNEDGQVVIHIRKPCSKVRDEETQFINHLQAMIAKPNIFFKITGSKALSEEMTVIVLTADDRMSLRRILATDLASALHQPQLKPQLDNLCIVDVCAKVKPSPEQLKAYLESPPAGLDPRVWKKAQEDNPDPDNMIPMPLLGPAALKNRLDTQAKESNMHHERLRLIADEVANLNNRHANVNVEVTQLRRRFTSLSHRIISAIVRLQMLQRQGTPLLPEEENLKKQLDDLLNQLNSPKHFRGRLHELMSHIRLHKTTQEARGPSKYSLDPAALEQIQDVLNLQQDSIKHLVDTVKADKEYVQRMAETVTEYHSKGLTN